MVNKDLFKKNKAVSKIKINDGLNKWQRYRLKDVDAYRKLKREYARTPEEREKRRKYQEKWREKNRERNNQLARESHHRNKHKHKDKIREWNLKNKYNISLEDYNKMLENQDGCCLICGLHYTEFKYSLNVDHCHKTGKIRGLLCGRCNGNLGWHELYEKKINQYLKKQE